MAGVIEACAQRGDAAGALDILQMMRGAAAAAASSASKKKKKGSAAAAAAAACPRPSYRSYLAALTACSRALPVAAATAAAAAEDNGGEGSGGSGDGVRGDWRAAKEVLRMMWEDEAARAAKGDVAVPGMDLPGEGRRV